LFLQRFSRLCVIDRLVYGGQVVREIIKRVYVAEKLALPPQGSFQEAQKVAQNTLNTIKRNGIFTFDYKKGGILLGEAATFFLVGEIIGRRSIIGYSA
jgi:F-type H+-transporting ATPase subunit g